MARKKSPSPRQLGPPAPAHSAREKKAALSRNQIKTRHPENDHLNPLTVDMIHQIITDQGRITETQVQALEQSGVSRLAYAELVGIVVCLFSIDEFCRALSQPLSELPRTSTGSCITTNAGESRNQDRFRSDDRSVMA